MNEISKELRIIIPLCAAISTLTFIFIQLFTMKAFDFESEDKAISGIDAIFFVINSWGIKQYIIVILPQFLGIVFISFISMVLYAFVKEKSNA